MSGKSRIPMTTQQAIADEYNAGVRTGDLALKYGHNRKTILQVASRMGCKMRHQHYQSGRPKMDTSAITEQIILLRNAGNSQPKIADVVGVCQSVVSRVLRKAGMPTRTGAINHGNWKGGVVATGTGYVAVSGGEFPEMHDMNGYTLEHRLVMARALGRAITKNETVHHINGDRTDNRIENLQLRQGQHGKGAVYVCACCGSTNVVSTKLAEA